MTKPRVDEAVGVLDRMTQILQVFEHDDRGIALSELAQRSGLPKSTVSRLVATLVHQRYLERDGRRIHLGLRVFELGQLARKPRALQSIALPILVHLRDKTREDVYLAIRDELELVCISALRGRAELASRVRVGARLPMHATALGKTVLAHSPTDLLDDVVAAGLHPSTPDTVTDEAMLRRQVTAIRSGAVAVEQREFSSDAASIALPVFSAVDTLLGGLAVAGSADEFDVERIEPLLRTGATRLSHRVSTFAMR